MEKAAAQAQGCDADKLLGICGSTFFVDHRDFAPLGREPGQPHRRWNLNIWAPFDLSVGPGLCSSQLATWRLCASPWLLSLSMLCLLSSSLDKNDALLPSASGFHLFYFAVRYAGFPRVPLDRTWSRPWKKGLNWGNIVLLRRVTVFLLAERLEHPRFLG